MAKWGEGDPRWIVEERADATNVNNWHWTEKNATDWSKIKLTELLFGVKIEDSKSGGEFKITEVDKMTGEATLNNRKSKLITFYEWDIKLKWETSLVVEGEDFTQGYLEIPNLSDENNVEDLDVKVLLSEEHSSHHGTKEWVRERVPNLVKTELAKYIRIMRDEFGANLILPTQPEEKNTAQAGATSKSQTTAQVEVKNVGNVSKPVSGGKVVSKSMTVSDTFQTSASELYSALTTKEKVAAFTRDGDCKFNPEVGGEFVLFHDNIRGIFRRLDADTVIEMDWRAKHWPADHWSKVKMTIENVSGGNGVKLIVEHTRVPSTDYDATYQGWSKYYFDPLKMTFGFGVRLFS